MLTFTEKNPRDYKAGEVVILRWVPASRIPKHHVQYVQKHVDRLAQENDLGPIRLRWFRPAEERPLIVTRKNGVVVDVAEVSLDGAERPVAGMVDGEPGEFWSDTEEDGTPVAFVTKSLPNTIALYETLRGDELPYVIAHEIRHLVQNRDGLEASEADADVYGAYYLQRAA
jgi:hypothetical protein